MPWYTGVLLGAERFMASWHKSEEEASKLREVNRAAKSAGEPSFAALSYLHLGLFAHKRV